MFKDRVFIPNSLREQVLSKFHEDHPGIVAMKSIARELIWYPGIDGDIENIVKSCLICQSVRSRPPQNVHVSWPMPSRVWSRIHIDHFFFDKHIFLIIIDALTKYIEVEIVKNTSAEETIDSLRMVFSRNGLPDVVCSDNATSFTANEFVNFLEVNGVSHVTSPPYSPASNGQAERGVRVMKELLKKQGTTGSVKSKLAKALFYYRCVPHNVTQVVPAVALNNRKLIRALDRINPRYCSAQNVSETNVKRVSQFEVGEDVLALNMSEGPKWLNAKIVQKLGINVYNVFVPTKGLVWKRHSSQLIGVPSPQVSCDDADPVSVSQHVSENKRIRNPPVRFCFDEYN